MESKIKILVAGDVRGNFKQFFQRVENVNKKAGPFEIVLCAGEFFGNNIQNEELNSYKNGKKQISVPIFILGPNEEKFENFYQNLENNEICSNLTYLGKRGLYTLSSGVKIAYLSGVEMLKADDNNKCSFNIKDIKALRDACLANVNYGADYRGVDILLTSQWPEGIVNDVGPTSKLMSFLCKEIKPRYHFCAFNGKHHETPPFRIPADQSTQYQLSTRFIALADVGNSTKEKYIYALSLKPVDKIRVSELLQKSTDEIECPFLKLDFSDFKIKSNSSESGQYFYDMNSQNDYQKRKGGEHRHHNKRPKVMQIDQDKCWFCLASPDVEKHLVISIGEHFYLALAKGPINDYHILILSITHLPCSAVLSEENWKELLQFKQSLKEFFKEQQQVVCFTERQYKTSHMQINVLGVDKGYAWKIKHSFEDKAEEFNFEFDTLPTLESPALLPQQGPYFVAELPDDSTLITRQMKHFPLHFARDVFCSENLLNCDEKVNWKDCVLDKDEEILMVQHFRDKYKKFDFTL